jgi:S-adenosyl methyltransferase
MGGRVELPDWAAGVDPDRPSAARIYDYLLGGSHNFAADREVARQAMAAMPDVAMQARANRDFVRRAVRLVSANGVRQFLDLGSGIPTQGSVHDMAPHARVVYVDLDPVAVAHSRRILAGHDRAIAVGADFRRPLDIVADPTVRAVLDFEQPMAVLLVAVLHAVGDADDPYRAVAQLRASIATGSYLVIAHGTADSRPDESGELVKVSQRTTTPLTLRRRDQIARFFDGFDLVEPGLVWAVQWHPDDPPPGAPERSGNLVGVGRKP